MHVWVRLRLFTALKALHSSALLGVEASLSCAVFLVGAWKLYEADLTSLTARYC